MNRIALMILKNLTKFPAAFIKLCHYAKHTEKYSWQEKWDHIHYMMGLAVKGGNVDLQVTGIENLPKDRAFIRACLMCWLSRPPAPCRWRWSTKRS